MKIRIILNRWDEFCRSVKIEVTGGEIIKMFMFGSVTQSQSLSGSGNPRPAKVSWSTIGSVSPSLAKAAGEALLAAAKVAEDMEVVKEWGFITPPKEGLRWVGQGMPEVFIENGKAWVGDAGWEDANGLDPHGYEPLRWL